MKIKVVLFLVSFLLVFFAMEAEQNEYYFRFYVSDYSQLQSITRQISIDSVEGNYVYAYANDEQFRKFSNSGYAIELLIHPGRRYKPLMTDEIDVKREFTQYPTYDAYVNLMNQFAADYPDVCSVQSLGNTVNGREILMAKISDNVQTDEAEPEFLYVATMHGDETLGYICLLNLIEYLLNNYGSVPRVTNLVDNLEIWISPLQNPDGTYYGGNNTVFDARRYNGNGIDLNRNFPDPELGDHPDGNDWQPETVIMMNFADDHHITMGANFHGGVEVINYPWDFQPELHADDDWYVYTSQIYANTAQANSPAGYFSGFNNGITNGYTWYQTHGGRQDYMNYFQYAREVTMEISETKLLPENLLEDYWNYNKEAMLSYMEESLNGIHGFVSDTNGNPLEAKIEVLNHDHEHSHVYSHPLTGDYHRLIAEGTYDLQASAFGFLPQTVQGITVTNDLPVSLDFVLPLAPQFNVTGHVEDGITHDPLSNAMIEFLNTPLEAVFTDFNGDYVLENVPAGMYEVYISADEYSNLLTEVTINENNTVQNFILCQSEIEDFETGNFSNFNWYFGGNADWTIDPDVSFEGLFAAKSGNISSNQTSSLILDLDVTIPGEISFQVKVSSEENYDFLEFYLDDELIQRWSGELDWQEFHYPVTAGLHQFKWSYEKDNSTIGGEDCAWLDLIAFPCTTPLSAINLPEVSQVTLLGNYPNPFNPVTTISFQIVSSSEVATSLEVFNVKGQKIITLLQDNLSAGTYEITWHGYDRNHKKVSSGLYFYKLQCNEDSFTEKMIMLK